MKLNEKKINIAFPWHKCIEKSWSGTAFQIVKQYKKNGYEVNLIYTNLSIFEKIIRKILRVIRLFYFAYRFSLYCERKKILKQMIQAPLFLFNQIDIPIDVPVYLYQDMTFNYLYNLTKTDYEAYKYSGFGISKRQLKKIADHSDKLYEYVTKIFTMGQYLKNYFMNNYNSTITKKVFYIGGGYNFSKSLLKITKKENSFLFVGKDFLRKSGDVVIEAFNKITSLIPEAKLYIIGPNKIPKNTNEKIVFLGELSFEDTLDYFLKSKVFVMPSRFEAYGLVFTEALVSGNIIIGSDKFEMTTFINQNNGYKTEINSDALAKVMLEAMNNEELSHEMVKLQEKNSKVYSWDTVFDRIERSGE